MSEQLTLNLEGLAKEVNRLHREAQTHATNAVEAAIACGAKLLEAKAGLRHGEFLPWLVAHFEGGRTTAWKYMRVAKELEGNVHRGEHLPSLREALRLVAGDDEGAEEPEPEASTGPHHVDARSESGGGGRSEPTTPGLTAHERKPASFEPPEPTHLQPRPMDVHFSSDKDDWGTPQDLFDGLNKRFKFTLDVCASSWNAKCKKFFSEEHDGLSREWVGSCWMNPPYGDEIGKWMEKAYGESRKRDCSVVCLVPARVDTAWWWDFALKGSIEHLRGRLRFLRPDGEGDSAPFPSAIVIFNNKRKRYVSYGDTVFIIEA